MAQIQVNTSARWVSQSGTHAATWNAAQRRWEDTGNDLGIDAVAVNDIWPDIGATNVTVSWGYAADPGGAVDCTLTYIDTSNVTQTVTVGSNAGGAAFTQTDSLALSNVDEIVSLQVEGVGDAQTKFVTSILFTYVQVPFWTDETGTQEFV